MPRLVVGVVVPFVEAAVLTATGSPQKGGMDPLTRSSHPTFTSW
jgi:hypothetical protein